MGARSRRQQVKFVTRDGERKSELDGGSEGRMEIVDGRLQLRQVTPATVCPVPVSPTMSNGSDSLRQTASFSSTILGGLVSVYGRDSIVVRDCRNGRETRPVLRKS